MTIHVGTSGWAYPSWKPGFYPPGLPASKFLQYYASQLNSVEVNFTFRQLPSGATLEKWLAATDSPFLFSFKAPQRITHFSRLKNCSETVTAFYASLAPVLSAKRLGVALFQLPPNFKADAELLDEFLSAAQRDGFRLAFEFRHESWFQDKTYSILTRHKAALCVAESDALTTPDVVTAPFRCYRLRKSEYSPTELAALVGDFRQKGERGEVFAYFKHEDAPGGALNAAELLRSLRSE